RYIAHSHFICADALRDLHSFPTRRSSDLLDVRHDDEIEEHPLQPRRAHHDCDDQSKLPRHRVELARHPDPRRAFGEFGSFELLLYTLAGSGELGLLEKLFAQFGAQALSVEIVTA